MLTYLPDRIIKLLSIVSSGTFSSSKYNNLMMPNSSAIESMVKLMRAFRTHSHTHTHTQTHTHTHRRGERERGVCGWSLWNWNWNWRETEGKASKQAAAPRCCICHGYCTFTFFFSKWNLIANNKMMIHFCQIFKKEKILVVC